MHAGRWLLPGDGYVSRIDFYASSLCCLYLAGHGEAETGKAAAEKALDIQVWAAEMVAIQARGL